MAVVRRKRKPSSGSGPVDDLKAMVDSLIKENQKLKRQIARLEAKSIARVGTSATRGLSTIARRLERALGSGTTSARRGRRTSASATGRTRRSGTGTPKVRKPASPETQAKRLAALVRAREARAAKKAASA